MILLDTSVLIDSLSGPKRSAPALREAITLGERVMVPSLVLYEWLRGPRVPEELSAQEALFPSAASVNFGPEEATLAAKLYRSVPRPRGREISPSLPAPLHGTPFSGRSTWMISPMSRGYGRADPADRY